jgi:putative ABC transport system ATP-binding protein
MLQVKRLSKTYGEGEARAAALRGVTLDVQDGDFLAIMGPSGSGKSTLLNIIGCLDAPSSGEVVWDGKRIDQLSESDLVAFRRRTIAYIFQQYHLVPSLTAIENVMLPLTFSGVSGIKSRERALEMLGRVGLEKRVNHRPGQLSGGEQQRAAIARALVNDPSLILADEPTGNVDLRNGEEIMGIFRSLNNSGRTILMVTHNPDVAKQAKRIVVLRDGEISDEHICR